MKPHIKRWCGRWICSIVVMGTLRLTGKGASMMEAYTDFEAQWRNLTN